MTRIGIVIPWFGVDLKGGAEQLAWQVASRLSKRGQQVDVLTTCCRSFLDDWATNHYPEGVSTEGNIKVIRFSVDKRNRAAFAKLNDSLLAEDRDNLKPGVSPLSEDDERVFVGENINSSAMNDYLSKQGATYQGIIFLPYLYGPILQGVARVGDRAYLQPCLHDEAYAYLASVAELFRRARGILFNSQGEYELALRLYGPGIIKKSMVIGSGVEHDGVGTGTPDPSVVAALKDLKYVLYVGRRDTTKNIELLVGAYRRYSLSQPTGMKLVLAGPGSHTYQDTAIGIYDFGVVTEQTRQHLLERCLALFQPSSNESYSRVIMEAWFQGKPVAANRHCLATAKVVAAAEGGWIAGSVEEWALLFEVIGRSSEAELSRLGTNGRNYAQEHADWERVTDRYQNLFDAPAEQTSIRASGALEPTSTPCAVHQLVAGFSPGDAISNHALAMRSHLREKGHDSEIYALYIDEAVKHEARNIREGADLGDAGLIYHHSTGSHATMTAVSHRGPKFLVYHNITPAHFFYGFDSLKAQELEEGRAELAQLARYFQACAGDSEFNAQELREMGFSNVAVIPFPVDPAVWLAPPSPTLMDSLQDGLANVLFVGRITPHKKQSDLVAAFSRLLDIDKRVRLILVGEFLPGDPYYDELLKSVARMQLEDRVRLPGKVTHAELNAYYRTAHLYWSMSEHEGFGVPLVEAMWFDIPLLAFKCTAISETLGSGGIMFTSKMDLNRVATMARLMIRDEELRERIIRGQRLQRERFLPDGVWREFDRITETIWA